jgi:hypothetical protein
LVENSRQQFFVFSGRTLVAIQEAKELVNGRSNLGGLHGSCLTVELSGAHGDA